MLRRRTAVWILSAACTSFSATAFAQDDTTTTPATDDPVTTGETTTSGTADATMQMTTPNTDMTTQEAYSPGFDGEDDDEDDDRFFLALRTGYAFPFGEVQDGDDLNDGVSGQVPFGLDIGYRVIPNLVLGVYGTYGLTFVKDCPEGADCSASNFRFGIQAQYHIAPREPVNPWVGVGVGYELLRLKAEAGGEEGKISVDGFEFLNLQAGVDFKVSDHVAIGPLVNFSVGQYSSGEFQLGDGPDPESQDIENKGLHHWLTIGGRVAFNL